MSKFVVSIKSLSFYQSNSYFSVNLENIVMGIIKGKFIVGHVGSVNFKVLKVKNIITVNLKVHYY